MKCFVKELSYYLNCPRIILYCSRNCSLEDFLLATQEAQELALKLGIKILIENPGDQKDGTINSAYDIQPFLSKVDHRIFGVNFDPGNFASHRPELDIYEHAKMALPYCEHLHIKDLTKDEEGFHFCAIGDGICKYDKLLQDIKKQGPSIFSVEAPFRLLRNLNGTGEPAAEKVPLQKIEDLIAKSINFTNKYIY